MSDVLMLVALLLLGIIVVGAIMFTVTDRRIKKLEDEVDYEIDKRRRRLTEANRFLFNEDILAEMFPEYSASDRRTVWKRIVARNRVEIDPVDNETRIKK